LSDLRSWFDTPWEELQVAAWNTRRVYHPDVLSFAVPGAKRYETEHYANDPHTFASASVTGHACALQCDHCQGQLLEGMQPTPDAESLLALGRKLRDEDCQGLLISGGAGLDGAVPLQDHLPAIAQLKAWGLRVIVHTGLLDRDMARGLAQAGVDQVLLDVIGSEDTIREVLHLDRTPADYAETLSLLREEGLSVAPHVIVGLHYGQLRGELAALEMVRQVGADVVVLVVLRPLPHTPMADLPGMDPETVGRLAAAARLSQPSVPLTLGCARPAGRHKIEIERRAVLAGVNVVAYPDPETVHLAEELGLEATFVERCCTLAV